MNSFEKSRPIQKPIGGPHLTAEYYEHYNSLFDLAMMESRIKAMHLPEEVSQRLKEPAQEMFLVLGSATTKNINGVTSIVHHVHGKKAALNDTVIFVDVNDHSIQLHQKAIRELDDASWSGVSDREKSIDHFPYPRFMVRKADIRSLPPDLDSVDVALSDYTINYLDSEKDIGDFFREVSRVLKENGVLYIALRYSQNGQAQERINQGGAEICTFRLGLYRSLAEKAGLRMLTAEPENSAGDILIVFQKEV